MNTASISMLICLGFFLLSLVNLRRAFLGFLFLAPFLPVYIAFPIGTDGAGLSAFRLVTHSIFFVFLASVVSNPVSWLDTWRLWMQEKVIFFAIFLLTVSRFTSTLINQDVRAAFYVWDESILILTITSVSTRVFTENRSILSLRFIFTTVALVIFFFLVFEIIAQRPILGYVLNLTVITAGENVLEGLVRSGKYRAQSFFDNPLSFAEYLLYLSVIFIFLFKNTSDKNKIFYFIMGVLAMISTVTTGSRFPFLVIGLICSSYLFFLMMQILSVGAQRVIALVTFATILSTAIIFSNVVADIALYLLSLGFVGGVDVSSRASIISRFDQWMAIPSEITKNSFFGILGEGYRSVLIERIDVRLDSYYLRLLIEGGWLAVGSFLLIFMRSVMSCASFLKSRNVIINRLRVGDVAFFLSVFFTTFFVSKLFLSMNFNNYLLFVFLGLLVSLHSRKNDAHPSHQ